ncbi:DNA replication and repair protein RecF [bacterium BMS3Abin04]|nr:DNA replication and repair protein RecF [bacterium BMS3Abin04]
MILNYLELKNFRLHKHTTINFSQKLNYIIGGNGQGKTSLLEAIYYLCTSKSLTQSSDSEAVTFNNSFFEITGEFNNGSKNYIQVLYNNENGKKVIFLNSKQVYRSSSIIGKFPVVTLTQSDHFITAGSPSHRRKFIDSVISQSSETYLKMLLEYNKILRQRSSLLSKIKETKNPIFSDELEAWTKTLIKTGAEIIKHRLLFVKDFEKFVADSFKEIMEEKEIPKIKYMFLQNGDENINIEELFERLLIKKRHEEIIRGLNLVGPHRDDFIFFINGFELKKYGSQGQNKTFQIALKFGQFFYMQDKLNKTPVFLMDDVFGELDSNRVKKISKFLREVGQAFITLTDFANSEFLTKSEDDLMISLNNGVVASA